MCLGEAAAAHGDGAGHEGHHASRLGHHRVNQHLVCYPLNIYQYCYYNSVVISP